MSLIEHWVWLSTIAGLGARACKALLERFETPESAYNGTEREYREVPGLKIGDIEKLMHKDLSVSKEALESCKKLGFSIIALDDPRYPDRLRNIFDPPVVLYVKGELPPIDEEPIVAVVGTRSSTSYGVKSAERICGDLAERGVIVSTGLARGIDTAAARGALRAGGRVIGVIGSGLDIVYPAENRNLFEEVAQKGAVISEYPPGTRAVPFHFPARNRIVSGVSLGVAVIEAPARSGALLTAYNAAEQGRDVFSLPGNIDMVSCEGSNALLREGAIAFMSAEDIISEYIDLFPDRIIPLGRLPEKRQAEAQESQGGRCPGSGKSRRGNDIVVDNASYEDYIDLDKIYQGLTGDENAVAVAIGAGSPVTDEIIEITGFSATRVLSALTMLEIKGCATRDGGGKWRLVRVV